MDEQYSTDYYSVGDHFWWTNARVDFIRSLVLQLHLPIDARVLDIGAGCGLLASTLQEDGFKAVYAADIATGSAAKCCSRGVIKTVVADAAFPPFKSASFDLIIASDIIEHLRDDQTAVRGWRGLLRTGGHLLVFAPAFPFLWSPIDDLSHHFRRYRPGELRRVCERAGFEVCRSSYWNVALFAPLAMVRVLQKDKAREGNRVLGDRKSPRLLNFVLRNWLLIENKILLRMNAPFGVSSFVSCRK